MLYYYSPLFLQRSFKLSLMYYQFLAVYQYRTAQTASSIGAFHKHLTNKPPQGWAAWAGTGSEAERSQSTPLTS